MIGATFSELKQILIDANKWLLVAREAFENGEYVNAQTGFGKFRMLVTSGLQKTDSLSVLAGNRQRSEILSFGFRPNGKDVRKSVASENLILRVLRGEANVQDITESTRPKNAKNE